MPETILKGSESRLERVPAGQWRAQVRDARAGSSKRLQFMTPDHHRVRRFAVSELPSRGGPLEIEWIAEELHLPAATVHTLLDDLERHLFFLVRDRRGRVTWAFPVTSETTPHRLRLSTGEQIFAA